jgi:ATP-binding cassette subfamily C protein
MLVPVLQLYVSGGGHQVSLPLGMGAAVAKTGAGGDVTLVCFAIACLLVLRSCVLVARDTAVARLQQGYVDATKTRLLQRIAAAPWQAVAAIDRARLIKALGSDLVQVSTAVQSSLQGMVSALVALAYLSLAVALAPALAPFEMLLFAAVLLTGSAALSQSRSAGKTTVRFELHMAGSAMRLLARLKLAAAHDLQHIFVGKYNDASRRAALDRISFIRSLSVNRHKAVLTVGVGGGAIFVYAVMFSDIKPGTLLAVIVLLWRAASPAAAVQQSVQQFANGVPLFEELHSLETGLAQRTPAVQPNPVTAPQLSNPRVELLAVSVFHRSDPDDRAVAALRDVSVAVEPGQLVGISGPTGAGKSTFLDVLAGLAVPTAGCVLVGGRGLAGSVIAEHRRSLSYLAADPVLFAGTIRENLLWMAPDVDDGRIWEVLHIVGAGAFIRDLPDGLDTQINDEGNNLSAGQGQQLALARALLRRPSLILLDEATCSLDLHREARLLRKLTLVEPRPTVLIISHRPETLVLCDRVLIFSQGSLVEDRAVSCTATVDDAPSIPAGASWTPLSYCGGASEAEVHPLSHAFSCLGPEQT